MPASSIFRPVEFFFIFFFSFSINEKKLVSPSYFRTASRLPVVFLFALVLVVINVVALVVYVVVSA